MSAAALGCTTRLCPISEKSSTPYFLDSLRDDLAKAGKNKQQLGKLKKRLSRIRVFDPACGSGNFLVIAYKQMREIEHQANLAAGWGAMESVILPTNFRGIEIKSFAAEVARLALIIAKYQADENYLGPKMAEMLFLPLSNRNWITCGNALRLDWLSICPPTGETAVKLHGDDLFNTPLDQSEIDFENEGGETYICGNPPYRGATEQSLSQKEDLERILSNRSSTWKSLDYVTGWFVKSADYLSTTNGEAALVSTNSITQGEQVARLWPLILNQGIEIHFAYTSFIWRNLASHNAGVTVIILGLSKEYENKRVLLRHQQDGSVAKSEVDNINPYLVPGKNIFVSANTNPLSEIPKMTNGNKSVDGGNLILSSEEKNLAIKSWPSTAKFIRPFLGSAEAINGKQRYCIWITESAVSEALEIPFISDRISNVKNFRQLSKKKLTRETAKVPHRFQQVRQSGDEKLILVPRVSSENRAFLPASFRCDTIISDSAFAIYDAPMWSMALVLSRLHLIWIGTVCGKLKTDFRYSNTLGWNTFPVPFLKLRDKEQLNRTAENIILAREAHFPATIADLYKPDTMPENLRAAHAENDRILEEIYIGRRFKNDTERLEKLFEMYSEMTRSVSAS